METPPPARRLYGEKEITRILRRASELQRAEPARPDPAGLSLHELEEIAREAGIDVHNLRRAASELESGGEADWVEMYLGAPFVLRLERIVAGEVDVHDLGMLVPLIQSVSGGAGQASVVGKTLTWHSATTNSSRQLQVLVTSKAGETLIRFEERSGGVATGLHVGIPSGGIGFGLPAAMALGTAAPVALGIAAGLVAVGGSYALARFIYRRMWHARRKKLAGLFEQVVTHVEEAARVTGLEGVEAGALPPPGGDPA